MKKAILIGIGGGTGAGKTTLLRALANQFGNTCVVDMDSYYLDRGGIRHEERNALNYDEPAAVDVALLLNHLERLAAGEIVWKPIYSFESHVRTGEQRLLPASLILVEGLFALWWEELRAHLNLKVFVDAPADLRLLRRIQRDVVERARSLESVLSQYVQAVRPMHERYVEPTRKHADLVVRNGGSIEECVELIAAAVRGIAGLLEEKPSR